MKEKDPVLPETLRDPSADDPCGPPVAGGSPASPARPEDVGGGRGLDPSSLSLSELRKIFRNKDSARYSEDEIDAVRREIYARCSPPPRQAADPLPEQPGGPRGVGGFLLLFCILSAVVTPLTTAFTILQTFSTAGFLVARVPAVEHYVYAETAVRASLMLLSLNAGLKLWRVKPRAVSRAKLFLQCSLLSCLVMFFLPVFFDFPGGLVERFRSAMIPQFILVGIVAPLWLAYFSVSRRVKATYGQG